MNERIDLPVPVLEYPHWRVVFRPLTYDKSKIPSISQLKEIVERNQVRLRGEDFPIIVKSNLESDNNWLASWSESGDSHYRYWRFYKSTQFLLLSSIEEKTMVFLDKQYRERFQPEMSRLSQQEKEDIPGFIDVHNFLFTVTEFFEFASRLCQSGVYTEQLEITLELKRIKGFALTTGTNRRQLWSVYQAEEETLSKPSLFEPPKLITQSNNAALKAVEWFFERFGWLPPPVHILKSDQEEFLAGRF